VWRKTNTCMLSDEHYSHCPNSVTALSALRLLSCTMAHLSATINTSARDTLHLKARSSSWSASIALHATSVEGSRATTDAQG
jgi:hypothetical protein